MWRSHVNMRMEGSYIRTVKKSLSSVLCGAAADDVRLEDPGQDFRGYSFPMTSPQKEHQAMAKTAKASRFLTLTAWPCGAARAHMRFRNCCAHAFINLDFAKNLGDCALTQGHRALTAGNLALTQSNRALTRRHRALTEGHRAPTSRQPGADSKQPGPCLKATGR